MRTEKYTDQANRLPNKGKQIIGQENEGNIIVYQAFNKSIANYAVANQHFGGNSYSFNRMSWIKPGFLWMMHRSGWGKKENQERILAIILPIVHFKTILQEATISSFDSSRFKTQDDWKSRMDNTEARLQWDPDHDPYGNKQIRKAIQLGMKGELLKKFCTEWIVGIEDITAFAHEQHEYALNGKLEELILPYEAVIKIEDKSIEENIGIEP